MTDIETPPSAPGAAAFQYVAVPIEHLPAVYRLLAQLSEVQPASPVGSGTETGAWTDEAYLRFASSDVKTAEIVGRVLDLLAEDPEETKLSIDELSDRTGYPRSQMKTVWTHLSRHLRTHYGTTEWPLETKWGNELVPPRAQVIYYYMTAAQAEQWKRARAA